MSSADNEVLRRWQPVVFVVLSLVCCSLRSYGHLASFKTPYFYSYTGDTLKAWRLDWSQCPAVESVPGKVSGAWVLKGTRMPISAVFENLEAGANIDKIMEWFDGLDREQVKAVIDRDVIPKQAAL
jgi:uncharacterized protein (DUF433 family)